MPSKTSLARTIPNEKKVKKRVLKKSLPRFTETFDRNGVSARAAAMFVTSLLDDIDMVTLTKTIYFDGKSDTRLKIY